MDEKVNILVVDDDENIRKSLQLILEKKGYETQTAGTGKEAVEKAKDCHFDLAFLDIKLPDMEGTGLLAPLKELHPDMEMIVVTAYASLDTAIRAMNAGSAGYLIKPLNMDVVLVRLEQIVEKQRLTLENRRLLKAVQQELIERRQTEEALQRSKEEWETTFDAMSDWVTLLDPDGRILRTNSAGEKFLGIPKTDIVGQICHKLIHKTDSMPPDCPLKRAFQTHQRETLELQPPGADRWLMVTVDPIMDDEGNLVSAVHVISDITKHKKMEEELKKVEKLESVGVLAGGIAHDFNNILTAILGNISLAKMNSKCEDEIHEMLSQAESASMQAKALTKQLLTFSSGGAPVRETASISEIIRESCNFALSGSKIKCDLNLPDELWTVEVDAGQISQVINNLVINADQAMPRGGVIQVRAGNKIVSETNGGLPLRPGRYIETSIHDQGIGIPEENLPKIYDPFFTTKQKGSGLGLASVFSIIRRHEGCITAESKLGAGTIFHVYLPALEARISKSRREVKIIPKGQGKVLVMDDEEMVRKITGIMIEQLGYEVEFAENGEEALRLYRQARDSDKPFDAVIMDLTIAGGMGGKEAVKKLLDIDPEANVIVSSGYSNDPVMSNFEEYGFRGVVVKPYKLEEMGKALHEVTTGAKQ